MSIELNKEQLKSLINFAKNEVLDDERAEETLMSNLGTLFNNEMGIHRVMMMSLAHAGQVNISAPVGAYPIGQKPQDITMAMAANDPFTNKVLDKLLRQATYFACFANAGTDYPMAVVKEARQLLTIGTKAALFNELDLRFANVAILMELLNRDQVGYDDGYFTLLDENALNGGQRYNKATLKFFHPTYNGNVYQIEKGVYQYNFQYTYLDNTISNSISFSNGDGTQVVYLPDGLLVFLDCAIRELYSEYNGAFQSPKQMVAIKTELVSRALGTIYDTCMGKFSPEDNLTHAEKMQAVQYFIREHLQYNRTLTMHGHKVAEISQYDVDVSEDNELIIFGTQVHTFGVSTEVKDGAEMSRRTYEKKKVRFEFNHIGVSNVVEELENEDDNVLLFNLWVLNAFEKEFQSVIHSAQHIDVLRKFGRTY